MDFTVLTKKHGIGLTGGIATGKTTVAHFIESEGHIVIDADILARSAVEPGSLSLAEIVRTFGAAILQEDGTLDREALASLVFNSPKSRLKLEAILHPAIRNLLEKKLISLGLDQHPGPWFYEAALLFEAGRAQEFRQIWATHCKQSTQINRLMKRNSYTLEQAHKILASQIPSAEKANKADVVIGTDASLEEVKALVLQELANM